MKGFSLFWCMGTGTLYLSRCNVGTPTLTLKILD